MTTMAAVTWPAARPAGGRPGCAGGLRPGGRHSHWQSAHNWLLRTLSRQTRYCAAGVSHGNGSRKLTETIPPAGSARSHKGTIRPRSDTTRGRGAQPAARHPARTGRPGRRCVLARPPAVGTMVAWTRPRADADPGHYRAWARRVRDRYPDGRLPGHHGRLPDPRRPAVPGGDRHRALGPGGPGRAGRAGCRPARPGHGGGDAHPPGSRGRHRGHRRDVPGRGGRGARARRPAPGRPGPADGQRPDGVRGRARRRCSAR